MYRIGIPRSLAYFIYFPLWKTFFEELGHQVIESPATSRIILDQGVKEAVNDACIPIKLYHGHVVHLADQCDYIFCPRLVSVRKHGDFGTETFCPKFLGLPDMVRLAIEQCPPLIDVRVDLKKGKQEFREVFLSVGAILGNSAREAETAYRKAQQVQNKFQALCYQGVLVPDALEAVIHGAEPANTPKDYDLKVAVVGYPYAIYDHYINAGLLKVLKQEKVQVYTQDMLPDRVLNHRAKDLPKSLFWYFSNRAVYGGLHFIRKRLVDGIIHVTAFACGPDSMVDRMLEIEARRRGPVPYLAIAVDEHTGEAGVRTRVEAFLDMLRYRRDGI